MEARRFSDGGWGRIFDDLGEVEGDDRGQTAWAVAVPAVSRGISRYFIVRELVFGGFCWG